MKQERLVVVVLEQGELDLVMWKDVKELGPSDSSGGVRSSWEAMAVEVCWSWEPKAAVEPTSYWVVAMPGR